jgi:hypothetical protein
VLQLRWPIWTSLAASFLAIAAAITILSLFSSGAWYWTGSAKAAPLPERAAVYLWHRDWSSPVVESARRAGHSFDDLMVLVGEMAVRGDRLVADPVDIPWPTLASVGRPTWLVIRSNVALASWLAATKETPAGRPLITFAQGVLAAARGAGLDVAGIQLDYDCPTSRLADYGRLVASLRENLPGVPVAITALPTWLDSPEFAALVGRCDEFVLQVHSLEKPTTFDRPIVLCRTERIGPWLDAAARLGVPFRVALPTCGYRMIFDQGGAFVGLRAEGPAPHWQPGYRERVVLPDPGEMVQAVALIRRERSANCRGIAWFRLPVSGDQLNWPWTTLQAVMAGSEPTIAFTAEVRRPEPELVEVWIANSGQQTIPRHVRTDVRLDRAELLAFDLVNGFRLDDAPPSALPEASLVTGPAACFMRLAGPAPAVGETVLAGWFRLKPARAELLDRQDISQIAIAVEVLP